MDKEKQQLKDVLKREEAIQEILKMAKYEFDSDNIENGLKESWDYGFKHGVCFILKTIEDSSKQDGCVNTFISRLEKCGDIFTGIEEMYNSMK